MIGKLCLSILFVCALVSHVSSKVVMCYHGTWSTYRSGDGNFGVSNIDPTLCTHLIYTFVGINSTDGSVILLDSYLDVDRGNFATFVALKQTNPNLKVLIAVGGWNQGSINYSNMAASATLRATFISSALALVQKYAFDGFDLDWEYPALRGGVSADKKNFITLIKEFREVFDEHGLLLTAAVSASATSVDTSYDVPRLSKYLDYINVMAYDLHGSWDAVTGHNAPLYASSLSTATSSITLNVATCIEGWISRGADPEKLVLGMPLYGRTFTLSDASNNYMGAATSGAGTAGPYTQESGMIGYNEICEYQLAGGWTEEWDDEQKVPYMYKDTQWIGFDNAESITYKVNYALSQNLSGVMVWSAETDDFKGKCGTVFELLKAANSALGSSSSDSDDLSNTTDNTDTDSADEAESDDESSDSDYDANSDDAETTVTTITTASTKTKSSSSSATSCSSSTGYILHESDCSKYYQCTLLADDTYKAVEMSCKDGLYFDIDTVSCNWPALVNCTVA